MGVDLSQMLLEALNPVQTIAADIQGRPSVARLVPDRDAEIKEPDIAASRM